MRAWQEGDIIAKRGEEEEEEEKERGTDPVVEAGVEVGGVSAIYFAFELATNFDLLKLGGRG